MTKKRDDLRTTKVRGIEVFMLLGLTIGTFALVAERAAADEPTTPPATAMQPTRAVAVLFPVDDSGVTGVVRLQSEGGKVKLTGEVRGLEPNTKHGFHVHEYGDLTDLKTGKSTGGHFAPDGSPHGKPSADAQQRHVGDLGNIQADAKGVARIDITDAIISLHGKHSVIGRAFVVHAGEDKFTQPTGDAGDRIAFGTIGIAQGAAK